MTERTGGCMCGAVRFSARDVPDTIGVCHCEMCRRWTGSALIEVDVPKGSISWEGETDIATLQSSDWAERGWCAKCGTGLFYRVTLDNDWAATISIPLGVFDDPNGFYMSHEIFIDHKPDSFAFAGEGRKVLTRQQCVEKFALLDSE